MKQFKKVYIEITNICNLRCDFCPQIRRAPEFMSVDTFRMILAQIKPHTNYIYLHVKGEPLLHPELDRLLDACAEVGFHVNITTNGTLISQVGDMLLNKKAIRQINFSLHSPGGNPAFGDASGYIQNILSFSRQALERTDMYLSYRLWNLQQGKNGKDHRQNQEMLQAIEDYYVLNYKIEEAVGVDKGIKIAHRVYVNQDYQFKWPDMTETEETASGFCYGLRSQAAILVDGTVVPCCLDGEGDIRLGNIHETSFFDIIESPRAKRIVDGFSNKEVVEPLCRRCGFMKRFQ